MGGNLLEGALTTCVRTAARENIVGWYSTGPKIREADLDINHLMSSYCSSDPILVICEVQVRSLL